MNTKNSFFFYSMYSVTSILVFIELYLVFFYAPTEKFMGHVQRLMYFHIPSAVIAYVAFFIVFVASILFLIKKNPIYDSLSSASVELGVFFTTIVLLTGPLWARPVWNTWWTWDPRLTTTLILWFIFIGYLFLYEGIGHDVKGKKLMAAYGIIGFVNVPIVHLSVNWWRSIHPQVAESGFQMANEMKVTLLFSLITFLFLYFLFLYLSLRIKMLNGRLFELQKEVQE